MKPLAALLTSLGSPFAWAHSGHGAAAPAHWHATDTLGFVLIVVLAAAAIWLSQGK